MNEFESPKNEKAARMANRILSWILTKVLQASKKGDKLG